MRRSPLVAALLLLSVAWCVPAAVAKDAPVAPPPAPADPVKPATEAVQGTLEIVDGHRVLTVWGTPYERGYAHGYLLADRILQGIRFDLETVMKPLMPKYDSLVTKVVAPAFAFAPHEVKELEGLLAGVTKRLTPKQMTIESLKRLVDLNDLKALNTFGDWYPLACSSLAVWGKQTADGAPLVGRNFDFPGFDLVLGHQIIVVRADDGARQGSVAVSYPGCIGATTGMSTQGLFVSIHDVRVRPPMMKALQKNVPRLLSVRRLFEQVKGDRPVEQANELLSSWPTLYGNNLMVAGGDAKGDAARAGVFETDHREEVDAGVTMRVCEPGCCGVACTNHHRKRTLVNPDAKPLFPRWRYPILEEQAKANGDTVITPTQMFLTMGRVAFPRSGPQQRVETVLDVATRKGFGTLHQAVAETGTRKLHLKIGMTGKNIRYRPTVVYDVVARVKAAGAKTAPVTPGPK